MLLQVWGGFCYLVNKVLFSKSERNLDKERKRKLLIWAWIIYLLGLPAWIVVFISENNWIAAAVEFGGAPAMMVGLVNAKRGFRNQSKYLDNFARGFVVLGIMISIYKLGGFGRLSQFLEIGISLGFLMGTYQMAKNKTSGYLWLMLGNISCAVLMMVTNFYILMIQQLVSLVFVLDAYFVRKKHFSKI